MRGGGDIMPLLMATTVSCRTYCSDQFIVQIFRLGFGLVKYIKTINLLNDLLEYIVIMQFYLVNCRPFPH